MMALMQRNLDLNPHHCERCTITELNWGEEIPEGIPSHPDVLLLADCVYLEKAFRPLVDTMRAMSTERTEILVRFEFSLPISSISTYKTFLYSSAINSDER